MCMELPLLEVRSENADVPHSCGIRLPRVAEV
jgi:hypothetical protein